jgi:RNA polymerase sigma-70 factor (ECF subfamily)
MVPPVPEASNSSDGPSLLERVAAGDASAPAECIDRFSGLVWSLARRLCSSAAEAEDAVQEIFIDVWKSAGRFDPGIASETTFVAMIARRRLIDRGRRRMRRPEVPQIAETIADASPVRNPSETAEEFGVAQRAFAQLRPEQQQVLQLAIHHGCSHEQIATATGMPLGTVKTHARRGLIKIRQILADQGVLAPEDLPRDLPQSQTSRASNTQDFPRIRDERASEARAETSSPRGDLQP